MDLDNFIQATLYSVIHSVCKVQENTVNLGVVVNPSTIKDGYIDNGGKRKLLNISFDVAVTIEENTKSERGGTIKVLELFGGNIGKEKKEANQTISKISFEVPIALPIMDNLQKKARKEMADKLKQLSSFT
ncbi:MAG: hypothetical protein ACTTJM_08855 [Bergeyella cardium]